MALTPKGIAHGYIADRVAEMLAFKGLDNILVDTGEFRGIAGHPRGGAWPVRLAGGGVVNLVDRQGRILHFSIYRTVDPPECVSRKSPSRGRRPPS